MTDDPREMGNDFDLRFMQRGKHSTMLCLPSDYLKSIGAIIAHWGQFEMVFTAHLGALINAEAKDQGHRQTEGWERAQFKRRRQLFKAVCSEWVAGWAKDQSIALLAICDRAGDLARKRNLIAHGAFKATLLPHSSSAVDCKVENTETGEIFKFDEYALKKLYHDISHLTADLLLVGNSIGKITNPPATLPDEQILRVYRETIHPWNPSPNRRPSPPEASLE